MSALDHGLSSECRCGKTMRLAQPRTPQRPHETHVHETHVNVYVCGDCGHEMRVTVWGNDVQAA